MTILPCGTGSRSSPEFLIRAFSKSEQATFGYLAVQPRWGAKCPNIACSDLAFPLYTMSA